MNEEELNENENFNWELKPPYHKFVWAIIRSVGWYIVGISVVFIYTWPYIHRKWSMWKKKKDDIEYDAKYHKDVDLYTERLVATQTAREKMQEKFLKEREIALKKEEEKQEKKRQEKIKSFGPTGYRLNSEVSENNQPSSSASSKSKFRTDYFPLMGGGNARYIPAKRSCCKKGGCG